MNQNVRRITVAALGAALVCICTSVFKFPIPLGYAHLGNCMILLFGVFFDPWIGASAGGVGSAISDLLGYPDWVLPTLIIKSIMGFVVAVIAGIVVMVVGYFIGGSILYGSVITGATQIPGLSAEGVVGIILFYVIAAALEAAGLTKKLAAV